MSDNFRTSLHGFRIAKQMESISTSCLISLALDLSVTWKQLARVLELDDEVERISEDYRGNVFEQAYRILLIWRQRNGSLATFQVLGEALRNPDISRNDLAQKYCENDNRDSSKTEINLEGQLRSGQVSMSDMNSISNDLGKDWLWVGRLLGLEDAALDNIRESRSQLYECSYQMLKSWAGKNGDQATYECLARALLHRAVGKRDIAEKYCLEHRQQQSASDVSPGEGIPVLDKKMKNLDLGDSSANKSGVASNPVNVQSDAEEEANKSKTGSTPSSPPVPDDCIMKNFIKIFPHKVWKGLVIKLDPVGIQGNYKDLASEMGFDMETILYFQSLKTPTEAVLNSCPITIEELCKKLAAIGRADAKLLIKEWVKSQNCKCAACSN